MSGDWVLMAPTVDMVKAGIDVLEGKAPSLAEDPGFSAAWARVPAGHVVAAYMDFESLGPLMDMATLGRRGPDRHGHRPLAGRRPAAHGHGHVPGRGGRPHDAGGLHHGRRADARAWPLGESDLATRFPADTQLYLETRELGTTLQTAIGGLLSTMDEQTTADMAPLEDMFGVPLPELLDFVSDASLGAGISSDGLWLGMAGEVTDEEVASDRVERVLSIVRLLGAGMGGEDAPQISVDETTIDGTVVTTVTLPIEEVTGGQLPVTIPNTLSVAVADGTLLIGLGDFVENALTGAEADSLAASPGYVDALGEDTTNSGVMYANVGSLLSVLDPLLAMMAPEWADIAPYATAIDRLIAVGTADRGRHQRPHVGHRRRVVEQGCTIRRAPFVRCPATPTSGTTAVRGPAPRPTGGLQSPLAVRIRLTRVGATKQPSYRFVVADSRSARDGRSLDTLGHYNPRSEPIEIHVDAEKASQVAGEGRPAHPHGGAPLPPRRHPARPRLAMAAVELVEYVAKSLVDDPDAVRVEAHEEDGGQVIELTVAEDDMGKVIGRNGSVAKALRTLLKVVAAREGQPISLEIV